jgi:hypothetical protein
MAYTTIKKPSDYFNTKLYTGNGSTQSITGVGFQPDLIWTKGRSVAENHNAYDIVRGAGERLIPNGTNAETTQTDTQTSFDSDGFTLGLNAEINGSGATYASWNWLADNTSGSSNTDGSITSTVSVNTTSGFSIVKYTGTGSPLTCGHGLGVAPKVIITKGLDVSNAWLIYTEMTGNDKYLRLDLTNAVSGSSIDYWNNTSPTSSVFSIGTTDANNNNGGENIAYCFAEVKGFSKFGLYTSNANVDGPFTYTGFKPAFVMIKSASLNESWFMYDTKRSTYNVVENFLFANSNSAEQTSTANSVDILSNGFKIRTTDSRLNSSGSYIYMAFAEEPLVGDNPATAR